MENNTKTITLTTEEVNALIYTITDVGETYEDVNWWDCDSTEDYEHIQGVAKALKTILAKIKED